MFVCGGLPVIGVHLSRVCSVGSVTWLQLSAALMSHMAASVTLLSSFLED